MNEEGAVFRSCYCTRPSPRTDRRYFVDMFVMVLAFALGSDALPKCCRGSLYVLQKLSAAASTLWYTEKG